MKCLFKLGFLRAFPVLVGHVVDLEHPSTKIQLSPPKTDWGKQNTSILLFEMKLGELIF